MAGIFGNAPLAFGIDSSMLGAGDARRDMLEESAERIKARRRAQARVPGAEGAAPMEREPEPVMADPFTAVDALLRGTVPAYSQARRDGLRAPTSREAVEGGVGMLPGAGLPEARQSFEDAAVAARQGDVMGAVGNTGWGALNAMDAFLPGPEFAAPLAAMAGGAGSRAGRQAMGGAPDFDAILRDLGDDWKGAPVIGPDGTVLHNAVEGRSVGGPAVMMQPDGTYRKGVIAYHGSPHDFDRFDLSKIGTGEGAQAYGHGLYFAEREGIARSYRDALSKDRLQLPDGSTFGGDTIGDFDTMMEQLEAAIKARGGTSEYGAQTPFDFDLEEAVAPWYEDGAVDLEGLPAFLRSRDDIDEFIEEKRGIWRDDELAEWKRKRLAAADDIERLLNDGMKAVRGRMYQVNIDANPDDFLDWDAPIVQQPKEVRDALVPSRGRFAKKVLTESELDEEISRMPAGFERDFAETYSREMFRNRGQTPTGHYIEEAESPSELTANLRNLGIPGIRYFDQGSRSAGEGTRNYVVFDDNLVKILRKYGIAGLLALGGGASLAAMTGQPAQAQEQ